MEQILSFSLILNGKPFKIPSRFKALSEFPQKIYDTLIFNHKHEYDVNSNVSEQVLRNFINYLITQQLPDITINNFIEFSELSQEFNQFKELIQEKQTEFGESLSYFNGLRTSNQKNRKFYEDQISQHLDDYLNQYKNEMLKLPIETLHNIFNHPNRKLINHDLAYTLIDLEFKRTNDSSIFILLPSLDGTKLSKQNFEDSIFKRDLHCGMTPKIDTSFLSNSIERQNQMEKQIISFQDVF